MNTKTKINVEIFAYSHINDHVFRSIEQVNCGAAVVSWNEFIASIKMYASQYSSFKFIETSYMCHVLEYGKEVLLLSEKEVKELMPNKEFLPKRKSIFDKQPTGLPSRPNAAKPNVGRRMTCHFRPVAFAQRPTCLRSGFK